MTLLGDENVIFIPPASKTAKTYDLSEPKTGPIQ